MRRTFMLTLLALALAAIFGAASVAGQTAGAPGADAKSAAIRRLLALRRTDSTLAATFETMTSMADTPGDELPPGFLDALRARVRQDIGLLVDRLVPLYDSLYSAEDIDALVTFYESPLGQRMVETESRIGDAAEAVSEQWGYEVLGRTMMDLSRQAKAPSEKNE